MTEISHTQGHYWWEQLQLWSIQLNLIFSRSLPTWPTIYSAPMWLLCDLLTSKTAIVQVLFRTIIWYRVYQDTGTVSGFVSAAFIAVAKILVTIFSHYRLHVIFRVFFQRCLVLCYRAWVFFVVSYAAFTLADRRPDQSGRRSARLVVSLH